MRSGEHSCTERDKSLSYKRRKTDVLDIELLKDWIVYRLETLKINSQRLNRSKYTTKDKEQLNKQTTILLLP